jgi:hypothetical protein
VNIVFKNDTARLAVYASAETSPNQRLLSVRSAAEEMARRLNLNFEIVRQGESDLPIYVYYETGDDAPIPLYCDEGKTGNKEEISLKIRNMMFVLSFHPRHEALRQTRKALFAFS